MPTFTAEYSGSVDVDFEVVCATCGHGLCQISNARNYRRGYAVEVTACPSCMQNKDDEIKELKDRIQELEVQKTLGE